MIRKRLLWLLENVPNMITMIVAIIILIWLFSVLS
jgi:hypothetical protein